MNNRINEKFEELSKSDQSAFVAYLCAGDPSYQKSLDSMHALANAGADIIEVGIPFSDPLADGIVNQMAAARALNAGMDVKKTLELISDFRKNSNTPIVIFTYLNPIYNYGFEKFHDDASSAGVDGILILDLPPDEQILNVELCKNKGLLPIRLVAPTTPNERIADISQKAEGFIYYVSREGVTGIQTSLSHDLDSQVENLKSITSLPLVVGFGISTPSQATKVAKIADGVVVGSAIVDFIDQNKNSSELPQLLEDFVRPLIEATRF